MDAEFQKRNTDCVYFLASPLTCKKGNACEFRHNEIARLNPRDCWYWLAGTCLNPACGFRHPPLDEHTEAPLNTASSLYESSVPTKKTNTPCYFYLNGFCNKGEKCSFLHESSLKPLKPASASTDEHPLKKKTSAGSHTVSSTIGKHLNQSVSAPNLTLESRSKSKDNNHTTVSFNTLDQNASPENTVSEFEEDFANNRSFQSSEKSSDDEHGDLDTLIGPEEWLESSPGLDVLADNTNKSENRIFEYDLENTQAVDYEENIGYDPTYSDAGNLCEHENHISYDDLIDSEDNFDYVQTLSIPSRERKLDYFPPSERKFVPIKRDLRDRLISKRRVVIDDHQSMPHLPRKYNWPHLIVQCCERQRSYNRSRIGTRIMHKRLRQEIGSSFIGSRSEINIGVNNVNKSRGWSRHLHPYRSRQYYKEKWVLTKQRLPSSAMSRKEVKTERVRVSRESIKEFTGPKSLAQIKEEKRKAGKERGSFGKIGFSSRNISEDFVGPKELNDILKNKRG